MPYQHFNALRSSRLAYKYFTEKWNQMSPAGAYLVKVRVPVNNSHRKSTQGCPTRWRSRFISDPGPIILLPLRMCFANQVEVCTGFFKVVTWIFQKMNWVCQVAAYFSRPNPPIFDQDFEACWSFCFCCWSDMILFATYGFDLDITFLLSRAAQ